MKPMKKFISVIMIKMLPNVEAYNDIVWRFRESLHCDAILTSGKGVTTYNMEHFDPFRK
jgi:hypothetical protein